MNKIKKDEEKAKKIGNKKRRKQQMANLRIPGDVVDNIFDEDGELKDFQVDDDDDYEDIEDDE
jgi:hypothetical protein